MNPDEVAILDTANLLLDMKPDPVPRHRILRDILQRPCDDAELNESKKASLQSRWVKELADEQTSWGGWARFHTMNTKAKAKVPTTESAVQRAVQAGLDINDTVVKKAVRYLEGLLTGSAPWPDGREPNDRWPTGEELFVGATLAELVPQHELLEPIYRKWVKIAERTFASGQYDPEEEWRTHCTLTGATTMRGSYLVIRNRYAVFMLAQRQDLLSQRTKKALLEWLWNLPNGLGYLDVSLSRGLERSSHPSIGRWFRSQMILSGFRVRLPVVRDTIRALWNVRGTSGLWDFGPRAGMKLSEAWRGRENRMIDHSIHCLLLLKALKATD